MPLKEKLLAKLKCCLHDDGHIVIEPLQLKCGGSACLTCITDIQTVSAKCYECNKAHETYDLKNSPPNIIAQTIVEVSVEDLFKYLQKKFQSLKSIKYFIKKLLISDYKLFVLRLFVC